MREAIGTYAENIGIICSILMFCSFAIEAVAKENAVAAAIFSPLAVFALLIAALWVADVRGWI